MYEITQNCPICTGCVKEIRDFLGKMFIALIKCFECFFFFDFVILNLLTVCSGRFERVKNGGIRSQH